MLLRMVIVLAMLSALRSTEAAEMRWLTAGMANRYCGNLDRLDNETRVMMQSTCATTLLDAYLAADMLLDSSVCLPKKAIETQSLAKLVADYQFRHAEEIKDTELLFSVALKALEEAWPCKSKLDALR